MQMGLYSVRQKRRAYKRARRNGHAKAHVCAELLCSALRRARQRFLRVGQRKTPQILCACRRRAAVSVRILSSRKRRKSLYYLDQASNFARKRISRPNPDNRRGRTGKNLPARLRLCSVYFVRACNCFASIGVIILIRIVYKRI